MPHMQEGSDYQQGLKGTKGISEADRRRVLERMREIKGVRIAFG